MVRGQPWDPSLAVSALRIRESQRRVLIICFEQSDVERDLFPRVINCLP